MTSVTAPTFRPIRWSEGAVRLIDQTRLPSEEVWLEFTNYRGVVAAIKEMRVRGAPAIGVAGAYAVALAALEVAHGQSSDFIAELRRAAEEIRNARPTGANLAWAVDRMLETADRAGSAELAADDLVAEATRIQDEDEAANRRIGDLGADILTPRSAVLTHCNAGALATGGYGTALGVILTAWNEGKLTRVFATETRPLLQGARLTAWELTQAGAATTLIPDSAAGQLMRLGEVQAVVVGADRVAANGDVANKIGTYSLAVLARENRLPFYVAAPISTVDLITPSGDSIPIEERSEDEVTTFAGVRTAPEGVAALNRAFDVTPHVYVTAIITEAGIVRAPYNLGLKRLVEETRG